MGLYPSNEAKGIGMAVERNAPFLVSAMCDLNAQALAANYRETDYVRHLVSKLQGLLSSPGVTDLQMTARSSFIHHKPMVRVLGGPWCELGDILFVAEYRREGGFTLGKKAVIFQVKLTKRVGGHTWEISDKQQVLLSEWPCFGLKWKRGVHQWINLTPTQRGFGSYVLARRLATPWGTNAPAIALPSARWCSGAACEGGASPVSVSCDPPSIPVRVPGTVDLGSLPYTKCFVLQLFEVLSWRGGEFLPTLRCPVHPRGTAQVESLLREIYDAAGLAWDTPGAPRPGPDARHDEGGLGVVEVTVTAPGRS